MYFPGFSLQPSTFYSSSPSFILQRDLSSSEGARAHIARGRLRPQPPSDSPEQEDIQNRHHRIGTSLAFTPSEVQVVLDQLRAFQDEWASREVTARQPIPDNRVAFPQPPPTPFLSPGMTFSGFQHVTHWTPGKAEQWKVDVTLQGYDHINGKICGIMTAQDVPEASAPVVTFFHGEIIDNINASFYTSHADWAALAETDLRHWSKFSAFSSLKKDVETYGGRVTGLTECGAVFMRWKEEYFITGGECRLTIAGFYYVALDRETGSIQALYFDPASSPDQKLKLKVCPSGECGHAFAAHELA